MQEGRLQKEERDFCYASAVYKAENGYYDKVKYGVGCDLDTIYNDRGLIRQEQVGDVITPPTAAFPAVQVGPQYALANVGTYEATLDIREGQLVGKCYVQRLWEPEFLPLD